jgi:uncharacterized protein YutE (UPF0331/DUF86 family)
MVSVEKITYKLGQLDESLAVLGKIRGAPLDVFLNDKILIGSAKYYLQISIECCLDVANHIISAERYRAPRDYADTFSVLEEEKVIDSGFATKLRQMAKFRNRLVHLYGEIDDAHVHEILQGELKDFLDFKKTILARFT